MNVLIRKNLYITTDKKTQVSFYFRHLETLHLSSFSTLSRFFFNQSMAFAGPRKENDTELEFPAHNHLRTIYPSRNDFCLHGAIGKSERN